MFWTAPPSSNSGKWRLAGIPGSKNGIVLVLTLTGWGSIPTQSCQLYTFSGNQPVTEGQPTSHIWDFHYGITDSHPLRSHFWALHVWRKPKHYCPKKCGVGKSSLSTAEAWAYNCNEFHEFIAFLGKVIRNWKACHLMSSRKAPEKPGTHMIFSLHTP